VKQSYITFRFQGSSPSGKTSIFRVETRNGGLLGTIRWYGPWRQYVFEPVPNTIWSAGCLNDVQKQLAAIKR
jgi:hypothetical protein